MRMTDEQVRDSKALIEQAQSIVITSHRSPDGDAVGSALAVYHLLKGLGKVVSVVLPDGVPSFLQWMKGFEDILIFESNRKSAGVKIDEADLIFSLDYNHLSRTGPDMEAALSAAKARFIMIDHHHQPAPYAAVIYSDTDSCSTAEMVYRFIDQCGWKSLINPALAECLYCGIMTDSGSFRFPSVTAETHHIAAELIDAGLDHARVHREVYDTNLLDRLKLIGFALNEKLHVIPECSVAYIWLTMEELKQYNYRQGDTEGLVNQALSISGVKLAAFFREGGNEIKISFRSKGNFDVNTFARKSWNGGGHSNAAGGSAQESIELAIERFIHEVKLNCDEINRS